MNKFLTKLPLCVLLHTVEEGVDEVEVMLDPDVSMDRQNIVDKARVVLERGGISNKTLVSILPRNNPIANDYDPMVIVGSHPSMFPFNKGGPPEGMSLTRWSCSILQRYPREQFARNVGAIPDMFNRIQRHQVNAQAHVQFNLSAHKLASFDCLDEDHVNVVMQAYASNAFGEGLKCIMAPLPPTAWDLYNALKAMAGRIIGTAQSFAALRSKVLSPHGVFGPYTCSINLCPSETGSEWTFSLAGCDYTIDDHGKPEDRPHTTQCYRIVAENPVAAAEFLHVYMRAICDIIFGWPMESDRQVNPNCLFGKICVAYLKYESSTRGGKHAHGQVLQPPLQAARLQALMDERKPVEHLLHSFMNGIMTAFFPIPEKPLDCPDMPISDMWREEAPVRNGERYMLHWIVA